MTNLLTEETALALAVRVVDISGLSGISKDVYEQIGWSRVFAAITAALLRAQKIAYLLGQIAGIEETNLYGSLEQEQSRLRELRAEMERIEL